MLPFFFKRNQNKIFFIILCLWNYFTDYHLFFKGADTMCEIMGKKPGHKLKKKQHRGGNGKLTFYSSTNENYSNNYCNPIYENKCSQTIHVLEHLDTSYSMH